MSFQKNISGQKWLVFAFNRTTNVPTTGDSANITARIRKDYAAGAASDDVNPTEIEDGYYEFTLTQAETNADVVDFFPESSTGDIQVIGVPGRSFTTYAAFSDSVSQTGDNYARLGAPAGASLSADIAVVDGVADNILIDTNELQTDWVNGGRLDLLVDSIITNIAALNDISTADVNGEVVDALNVDTYVESSGVPAATASIQTKLTWLYTLSRNKGTQTATTKTLRNDADSGDIATSTVSDDGTTFTRGEYS